MPSGKVAACFLLFRLLLPLALLGATVVRYNGFSFVYLCLLLTTPLMPRPDSRSMPGHTQRFLIISLSLCSIMLLGQVVFQAYLLGVSTPDKPYGTVLKNCSQLESSLRQLGLQRLEPNDFGNILRVILPDLGMFLVSLIVFLVCRRLSVESTSESRRGSGGMTEEGDSSYQRGSQQLGQSTSYNPQVSGYEEDVEDSDESLQHTLSGVKKRIYHRSAKIIRFLGEFFVGFFLGACGIIWPCIFTSTYFIMFLGLCTWWACYKSLGKTWAIIRILLLLYSAAHLIVIYFYQFQFFQLALPPDKLLSRVLGLTSLVYTDCRKPWMLQISILSEDNEKFGNISWPAYVCPGLVLFLYHTLACETRHWITGENAEEVDATAAATAGSTRRVRSSSPRKQTTSGGLRRNVGSTSSERQVLPHHLVGQGETNDHDHEVLVHEGNMPATYNAIDKDDDAGSIGMDVQDYDDDPGAPALDPSKRTRSPLESVLVYIMKQSYISALIIMMVWSITYHSWLTFVYLMSACIIWMIPRKRSFCLAVSPLIVCYAEALLTMQFVYGFNLTDKELPTETAAGYKFKEIGLVKYDNVCLHLGAQALFTLAFWVTLRQYMREKAFSQLDFQGLALTPVRNDAERVTETAAAMESSILRQSTPGLATKDYVDGHDSDNMKELGTWLWHVLCKYWIFVCAAMFLVMAVQEAVIYRIIYMVLFLYFVLSFQIAYSWWRRAIYVFWWVVIFYSMVVLCLIYTYQFEGFPGLWQNGTGLSDDVLEDIGLEQFPTATLFATLLTPTSFLIVIILQVHYFQTTFNDVSHPHRFMNYEPMQNESERKEDEEEPDGLATSGHLQGETSNGAAPVADGSGFQPEGGVLKTDDDEGRWQDRCVEWCKRVFVFWSHLLSRFSQLIWRCLEVHITKVVMFTIFFCCLVEVNAMNLVFVVLLLVGIPIPQLQGVMSHLCQVWAGVVILAKMTYQLRLVPHDYVMSNCSSVSNLEPNQSFPPPFNDTIDNADYVGLNITDNLAYYLRLYMLIVIILAFEAVIKIHQQQHFNSPLHERPKTGIIFLHIKREDADLSLIHCAKFFANYLFYKFGLEICFIMTMVTMVVRLDAYSVIYGIFLGILLALSRRQCYYVWPGYIMVLIIILALQYLSCLGVPPGLCWDYPWDQIKQFLTVNLKIYLYLPDYEDGPDAIKLVADFFQLLFVCLQWRVFYMEKNGEWVAYGGGDNQDIVQDIEEKKPNPVEDYLSCKDYIDHCSYLDYIKSGLFQYMFWVTLIIVFIAGTTRISLFCMGYLVGCFFFLWFGHDLLVKPLRNLLRLWGILLGYNFFVILSKAFLQLVGCVYLSQLSATLCWLIQLFSVVCLKAGNYVQEDVSTGDCNLDEDQSGLTWDAICFVFLLLQLRVYKSHYFRHVVNELKIQSKLASRGAELINTNLFNKVERMKQGEQAVLSGIKRKMEKIKHRQERLQEKAIIDSDDHYIVIRSGDYYMFDDDTDEDTETTDTLSDRGDDSDDLDSLEGATDKIDPLMLINTAMREGTKEALNTVDRQSSVDGRRSSSSGFRTPRTSFVDRLSVSESVKSPRSPRISNTLEEEDTDEPVTADDRTPSGLPGPGPTPSTSTYDNQALMISPSSPMQPNDMPITSPGESEKQVAVLDQDYHMIDGDDLEDFEHPKETWRTRLWNGLKLAWAVIAGVLDVMIGILNDISREYRSVSRVLAKEMEAEKRKLKDEEQHNGSQPKTEDDEANKKDEAAGDTKLPQDEKQELLRAKRPTDIALTIDVPDLHRENTDTVEFDKSIDQLRQAEKEFHNRMPRILQLFIALFDALMSRSEIACYFAMILNHMISASLLSLAYPTSVFLWAMLSVPRPTKTYWVTIITYTEAVVVVKYLFQFGFFPWNDGTINDNPFWPPRIIGIERKQNYAVFDLILLFTLFIHRSVLKKHGLWKDAADAEQDMAKAEREVTSRATTPTATNAPISYNPQGDAVALVEHVELEFNSSANHSAEKKKRRKKKSNVKLLKMCFGPFYEFYQQMTNPKYNAVTDVYAPMFLCDFIAFIIIVFGYTSFGPADATAGTETVTSVISENKVPVPFLIMLLTQFIMIIVDRALFLRKNVFGKFVYQIFLVIVIHVWMFFILPMVTDRRFSQNTAAQLWYFVKCIYFGLSAYQIRSSYPTRILGNFLTKKYNYINLFLFQGFMAIPFLLELRAVMDWMWTDTTLALSSWLQMEDVYANIFVLKCWRQSEKKYPTLRGQKRRGLVKYGQGGVILGVLVFIIWFPLLLFSLANTVYEANPPVDVSINMKIGGFEPIFRMSAQQTNLGNVSESNYTRLSNAYSRSVSATAFLLAYKNEDVMVATVNGNSTSVWGISPPTEQSLHSYLTSNNTVNLITTVSITREPHVGVATETVTNQFIKKLDSDGSDRLWRDSLAKMINSESNDTVTIPGVFPRYLRVPGSEKPEIVRSLNQTMGEVIFQLRRGNNTQWWELRELGPEDPFNPESSKKETDFLTIVTFNDRVAPGAFSFFTSYGVIGLYISLVLVIGRFVRMFMWGTSTQIMFRELPNVDRVLKLCLDIYLVRESREYRLEEDLFAKLLFLYRSPKMLHKWTKFKHEKTD